MHKTKILYVDDEPFNLMLFEAHLEKDFDIITAINGEEGIEKLRLNPDISIVFSDLKMPKMNGIEFVTKAYSQNATIIYYMVTGFDNNDEINDLMENKILKKHFHKPFNMKEIISEINSVLTLKNL